MALKANSFEGGANGSAITAAGSGGASGDAFSLAQTGTAATLVWSNAQAMHGGMSALITANIAASSGQGNAQLVYSGYTATSAATRFYLRFNSMPTAVASIFGLFTTSGTAYTYINANGTVRVDDLTGQQYVTPSALVANTWFRVEQVWIRGTTTTNGTINFAIYAGDSTTPLHSFSSSAVNAGTTQTISNIQFGRPSALANPTSVYSFHVDDVAANDGATAFIGPAQSGGQVIDRWNGTALVRQRIDRWSGSASVLQRLGEGTTTPPPAIADPTTVTGLVHRWRSDSIAQANGTAVATWPSLTGGVSLAQGTAANQPVYITSGFGGRPTVRFTTASQHWLTATLTSRAQPYTVVYVHKLNRTAAPNQQLWHATGQIITLPPGYDAFAGTDLIGGTATTSPAVITWVANGATSRLLLNGTQVAAGNSGTSAIGTTLRVGANTGNTQYADMDLSEVLVYTGAKSDTELSTINSYVRDYYGMTVA